MEKRSSNLVKICEICGSKSLFSPAGMEFFVLGFDEFSVYVGVYLGSGYG
jgi:hypothetical protein